MKMTFEELVSRYTTTQRFYRQALENGYKATAEELANTMTGILMLMLNHYPTECDEIIYSK